MKSGVCGCVMVSVRFVLKLLLAGCDERGDLKDHLEYVTL